MSSPLPSNPAEFLRAARSCGAVDSARLSGFLAAHPLAGLPTDTDEFAARLVKDGLLTDFQAQLLLLGRADNLRVGRYRLIDLLGKGGMGSVFLAADPKLDRRVAVKVLRPADRGGLVRARFEREAQAAAAVDHPHVVRAFDYGDEGGLLFLVMEYVPGVDLQKLVWRRGPLPAGLACEYLRQAALGLHAVHAAGLVHRDVKPGNLMVDPHGTVKLLDLGLVRDTGPDADGLTRAQGAGYVGTLEYLAPEQLTGSSPADRRADVFGLGASLIYLLTGRHPRDDRDGPVSPVAVLTRDLPRLRDRRADVPAALDDLCGELTARDPAARVPSAAAAADRLAAFADPADEVGAGPPPVPGAAARTPVTPAARTPLAPTPKPAGRRRWRWRLGAGVAAAAAGLGLLPLGPGGQTVTEVPARAVPRAFVEVTGELGRAGTKVAWVGLSADGRTAVTAGRDDPVRVWDVPAGTSRPLSDRPPHTVHVSVSPDGRRASWAKDKATAVYADTATGAEAARLTTAGNLLLTAAAADRFAAVDVAGRLHAWRADAGPRRVELVNALAPGSHLTPSGLVFTPDGRLAVLDHLSQVLVVDVWGAAAVEFGVGGFQPTVFKLLAAAGDRVVIGDSQQMAVLRRQPPPRRLRLERLVPGDVRPLQAAAFALSASGRLALVGYDGGLRVWDLDTGAERHDRPLPGRTPHAVAVSADGTTGLAGLTDGTVLRLRLAGFE